LNKEKVFKELKSTYIWKKNPHPKPSHKQFFPLQNHDIKKNSNSERHHTRTSSISTSKPANPPISSVHDEIPDAATDTPTVICCNSTSNLESVSPLHKYEQNLCPPIKVLLVRDMYSQEVEAGVRPVRLLNPSCMAC